MEQTHKEQHAELETIRYVILAERAQQQNISYNTLEDLLKLQRFLWVSPDGHQCTQKQCTPMSFQSGRTFRHPVTGRQHLANGRVYVCRVSGFAHTCTVDQCRSQYMNPGTNQHTCRITNLVYDSVVAVNPYQDMHKHQEDTVDYADEHQLAAPPSLHVPHHHSHSPNALELSNDEDGEINTL